MIPDLQSEHGDVAHEAAELKDLEHGKDRREKIVKKGLEKAKRGIDHTAEVMGHLRHVLRDHMPKEELDSLIHGVMDNVHSRIHHHRRASTRELVGDEDA